MLRLTEFAELRQELQTARKNKQFTAAFDSIISRHYDVLHNVTAEEIRSFIRQLDVDEDYYISAKKNLNRIAYDLNR